MHIYPSERAETAGRCPAHSERAADTEWATSPACTPITVVNVDAGFTAGAQAGLVARSVSAARLE